MELKDKIYELRTTKSLSQEKLAEKLNVSRQALAKWENGESYPEINNLIALSNLFMISIDRLLKDDTCIENIVEREINEDDTLDFLITAKKNTYAGSGKKEEQSSRPKSNDLIYEKGKYKYIDSYLGGENFIGEEALFEDNNPIWAMNYYGIEKSPNFSSLFLKKALSKVPRKSPFRGPSVFKEGDYLYTCTHRGDFNYFHGIEKIYYQDELVFECTFHGGLVK